MATVELNSIAGECLKKISQYRNQIDVGVIKSAPWDVFEVSLAISSLLEAHCPREIFLNNADTLVSVFSEWLDHGRTATRLAPRTKRDLEVTAAIITALNLLGTPTLANEVITSFDTDRVDASSTEDDDFAADCEVLVALVNVEDGINRYRKQIEQFAASICSFWWARSHKQVTNRRNVSHIYSTMLVTRALTTYAIAQSTIPDLKEGTLDNKISLMLTEALVTVLRTQNTDGSWGERSSFEETSYAVLVIKYLTAFPFAHNFESEIQRALDCTFQAFNRIHSEWHSPDNLWTGNILHSSPVLARAYIVSALKKPAWLKPPNMRRFGRFSLSSSSEKLSKLAYALPLLQNVEAWQVKSCLLQGDLFASIVRASIPRIFPRENMRKETYLDLVPFTWATSRQFETLRLRNQELLDMMVLAVTIYQVDEFMEATVIQLDNYDMRNLEDAFDDLCSDRIITTGGRAENSDATSSSKEPLRRSLKVIIDILRQYIQFILQHPSVQTARPSLQRQLRSDIRRFLRSHIRQVKDNRLLRAHQLKAIESVHGSFFSWIRNTSSDHTGGPFAMTYYLCLIEGRNDSAQPISTEGLYVAQMVSQHLAALCRTYNDWGSRVRDKAEFNVNSLDFEEVGSGWNSLDEISEKEAFPEKNDTASAARHAEPERRLLFIAEFERRCMLNSLRELKEIVSSEVYVAVKLFCDVTDVYGQIYMIRDMTPKLTDTEK